MFARRLKFASGSLGGTNGKLVKNGAGTLTLTGGSSYTGGTTINNGPVKANNNATGTAGNDAGGWDLATVNGTLTFQAVPP